MTKQEFMWKIRTAILLKWKEETGQGYVPVGISNRHVHLSSQDLEALFGKGYQLKKKNMLQQPGQFAAEETVTIQGRKGKLERVRVLGPVRPQTQVEISITDSFALGVEAAVRMSGDLASTPGIRLIGPVGQIDLAYGTIVAARHLHLSKEEARVYGLQNGDIVKLRSRGQREMLFENVVVRCGDGHELEVHLDVDEANAAQLKNGDCLEISP